MLGTSLGKSFALAEFLGLSKLPSVRLISLQVNDGVEQLGDLPEGMKVETLGDDFDLGDDAFLDTAAVMENLDLVVSADTSVAHLAGALGRPVWVALKWVPDWRWLLDRSDSPWYPTMRLFRQRASDDWRGCFRTSKARSANSYRGQSRRSPRARPARATIDEAGVRQAFEKLFPVIWGNFSSSAISTPRSCASARQGLKKGADPLLRRALPPLIDVNTPRPISVDRCDGARFLPRWSRPKKWSNSLPFPSTFSPAACSMSWSGRNQSSISPRSASSKPLRGAISPSRSTNIAPRRRSARRRGRTPRWRRTSRSPGSPAGG